MRTGVVRGMTRRSTLHLRSVGFPVLPRTSVAIVAYLAADWLTAARRRRAGAVLAAHPRRRRLRRARGGSITPGEALQKRERAAGAPPADREGQPVVTATDAVPASPVDSASVAASVTQTLRLGHGAVLRAIRGNTVNVPLPVLGTVQLPPLDSLALYGGLAILAAVGLMEWPVAAAIGVGHLLVQQQHFRLLHDFGEALEEA